MISVGYGMNTKIPFLIFGLLVTLWQGLWAAEKEEGRVPAELFVNASQSVHLYPEVERIPQRQHADSSTSTSLTSREEFPNPQGGTSCEHAPSDLGRYHFMGVLGIIDLAMKIFPYFSLKESLNVLSINHTCWDDISLWCGFSSIHTKASKDFKTLDDIRTWIKVWSLKKIFRESFIKNPNLGYIKSKLSESLKRLVHEPYLISVLMEEMLKCWGISLDQAEFGFTWINTLAFYETGFFEHIPYPLRRVYLSHVAARKNSDGTPEVGAEHAKNFLSQMPEVKEEINDVPVTE